jgi:hypothetical protein
VTGMATTTPVRQAANGVRRTALPVPRMARHRQRVRLAAACYAGIVLLVGLAVAMGRVLPAAVGVPLFIALAATVVAIAHPGLRLTLRR